MNILRQLAEKPWEPPQGPAVALYAGRNFPHLSSPTLGLRVFLCVVTVLFSLLIVAYAERMAYEDWRPAPRQWLLWLNTASLVVSSLAFQWALISVRRGRVDDTKAGLIAAGLFAAVFLLGQVWAWRQLNAMIYFDVTNPAIAFFYLITALHALHLLGGLVAWGRTTAEVWREPEMARAKRLVALCTTYWHFLLALWLILFGLLFSGDDNLNILLSICGLR
jgi:cytochrome c oxidase subunit 3